MSWSDFGLMSAGQVFNALGGRGSQLSQYSLNKKYSKFLNDMSLENLTKAPALQKQGLKAAGLNTAAMDGQASANVAAQPGNVSAPDFSFNPLDLVTAKNQSAQTRAMVGQSNAAADQSEAQAALLRSQTEEQKIHNEFARSLYENDVKKGSTSIDYMIKQGDLLGVEKAYKQKSLSLLDSEIETSNFELKKNKDSYNIWFKTQEENLNNIIEHGKLTRWQQSEIRSMIGKLSQETEHLKIENRYYDEFNKMSVSEKKAFVNNLHAQLTGLHSENDVKKLQGELAKRGVVDSSSMLYQIMALQNSGDSAAGSAAATIMSLGVLAKLGLFVKAIF